MQRTTHPRRRCLNLPRLLIPYLNSRKKLGGKMKDRSYLSYELKYENKNSFRHGKNQKRVQRTSESYPPAIETRKLSERSRQRLKLWCKTLANHHRLLKASRMKGIIWTPRTCRIRSTADPRRNLMREFFKRGITLRKKPRTTHLRELEWVLPSANLGDSIDQKISDDHWS